jgi:predicted DNA-binding ribbon-helix-helix protein
MNIKMLTKMFRTGTQREKTTLNLHKPIYDTLKFLADKNGTTVTDLVADILDDYLTEYVRQGYLEGPVANPDQSDQKAEGA